MTRAEKLMMAAWWWTLGAESHEKYEDAPVLTDTMIACYQAAGSELCRAFATFVDAGYEI